MNKGLCIFCGFSFDEHGHDARPLAEGKCCNRCNSRLVIPARLKKQREEALDRARKASEAN